MPLLAGWNADEIRAGVVLGKQKPTAQSFAADARKRFGDHADAVLKAYPAATDAEALESAAALASDLFIGHATWKWIELHAQTGGAPVYRYSFDRKIPVAPDAKVNGVAGDVARHRRAARRRDRVRVRDPRLDPQRAVGAGRSEAVGRDDDLLVQLRAHRRSEWSRPAGMAAVRRAAADASCTSTRRSATRRMRCGLATRRSMRT